MTITTHLKTKQAKSTLLILIVCLLSFSCDNDDDFGRINGSGNLLTQDRSVNTFNVVESPSSIDINIVYGNSQKISITADDNVIHKVTTKVIDNRLIADLEPGNYNNIKVAVNVISPHLDMVKNSGSGRISVSGFTDLTTFTSRNSGSGDIILKGRVTNHNCLNSGSGKTKSFQFISTNCLITNSGSGDCEIYSSNNLSGDLSGSGTILYKGNPTVAVNSSGSGKIINVN